MNIPHYDSWKLSSGRDNEKVSCTCVHCNGEIYKGEVFYYLNSDSLCEDCIVDYVKENMARRMEAK